MSLHDIIIFKDTIINIINNKFQFKSENPYENLITLYDSSNNSNKKDALLILDNIDLKTSMCEYLNYENITHSNVIWIKLYDAQKITLKLYNRSKNNEKYELDGNNSLYYYINWDPSMKYDDTTEMILEAPKISV